MREGLKLDDLTHREQWVAHLARSNHDECRRSLELPQQAAEHLARDVVGPMPVIQNENEATLLAEGVEEPHQRRDERLPHLVRIRRWRVARAGSYQVQQHVARR